MLAAQASRRRRSPRVNTEVRSCTASTMPLRWDAPLRRLRRRQTTRRSVTSERIVRRDIAAVNLAAQQTPHRHVMPPKTANDDTFCRPRQTGCHRSAFRGRFKSRWRLARSHGAAGLESLFCSIVLVRRP